VCVAFVLCKISLDAVDGGGNPKRGWAPLALPAGTDPDICWIVEHALVADAAERASIADILASPSARSLRGTVGSRSQLLSAARTEGSADFSRGLALLLGTGVASDAASAIAAFRAAASAGHAGGHAFLGKLLQRGLGVAIDAVAARTHLERAAEAGDTYARAHCLHEGWGGAKDAVAAVTLAR
jgi:TPR repeat protein